MRQIFFLYLICKTINKMSTSELKSALRLRGGRDALPGEFPYAVRIVTHTNTTIFESGQNKTQSSVSGSCSGAALTTTIVLSNAHCLKCCEKFYQIKNYTITDNGKSQLFIEEIRKMIAYGDPHLKFSDHIKLAAIVRVTMWNGPQKYNIREPRMDDIALYHSEPMPINSFARLSAVDYTTLIGHEVTPTGYGLMGEPYQGMFGMQDKPLQVWDKALLISCGSTVKYSFISKEDGISLCAVPKCGKLQTATHGDSGSPVVHQSGVIGLITDGTSDIFLNELKMFKNIAKPSITIITPVSPYLDWIQSEVNAQLKI